MAIDSLRKRASIASLGLAFLGPSVIPDGSFVAADRQTIANSYYGILTTANPVKTIGGTSQLEGFASSAALKVGRNLGDSSQLEVFTSSGGIDVLLPKTIGGTSQLEAFTSSGTIDSGTGVSISAPGGVGRRHRKPIRLPDGRITIGDDSEIKRLLDFYKVDQETLEASFVELPMQTRRQRRVIKNKAIPAPQIIEELEEDIDLQFIVDEIARLLSA